MPQVGRLSPLLWSLIVTELWDLLTSNGIRCQVYADDTVIIEKGKFESSLCDIIQRGLTLANSWCKNLGLNIGSSKTATNPFIRTRYLPSLRNPTLDRLKVARVDKIKCHGSMSVLLRLQSRGIRPHTPGLHRNRQESGNRTNKSGERAHYSY